MKDITIKNIAAVTGGTIYYADENDTREATGVVIDSRLVEEGMVFAASVGERIDSHKFINYVEAADHLSKTAECERHDATHTAAIRWGSVSWNYAYSYHVPGKTEPETGEQEHLARAL